MTAFTAWLDDTMPELPGAPRELVLYHIKRSAFDFMRRSGLFRKTTGLIDVNALPGDIAVPTSELADTYQVLDILGAWWARKPLDPATTAELVDRFGPDWPDLTGTPTHYTQETLDTLRLVPQPSDVTNDVLRLEIVYGPNESATDVPDIVFQRYREPIAFGAKGRLMVMDKKPWSNPEKAGAYQAILNAAIDGARLRVTRGTAARAWQTSATTPF